MSRAQASYAAKTRERATLELVARIIRANREYGSRPGSGAGTATDIAQDIATHLAEPDRSAFLASCGVENTK